jgi:hypothetical protein
LRGNDIEVLAGIAAGDEVVAAGPPTLKDGQSYSLKK